MPCCTVELRVSPGRMGDALMMRLARDLDLAATPEPDGAGRAYLDFWGTDDDMRPRVVNGLDRCGHYYGVEWRDWLDVA